MASTSSTKPSKQGKKTSTKRRRTEQEQLVHPHILKFETCESKLHVMLNKMFELADTNMLLCNCDSGVNDYSLNKKLADKLESIGKFLVGLSKRCTEKANKIRDKIAAAEDKKINMQDVICSGEILKQSKKCDFLKECDARPKHWITDQSKLIKREVVERIYSDDSEDEQEVYGGDMIVNLRTQRTTTIDLTNMYVISVKKSLGTHMNDKTISHITTKNCITA